MSDEQTLTKYRRYLIVKLLFVHIFMKMSTARILVNLTLPKIVRKLSDSNTLGNLLKLYNVEK